MPAPITVVDGEIAGLATGSTCAELGAGLQLFEAHRPLEPRARSSEGPFAILTYRPSG